MLRVMSTTLVFMFSPLFGYKLIVCKATVGCNVTFSSILLGSRIAKKFINPVVLTLSVSEGVILMQHQTFFVSVFKCLIWNAFYI